MVGLTRRSLLPPLGRSEAVAPLIEEGMMDDIFALYMKISIFVFCAGGILVILGLCYRILFK